MKASILTLPMSFAGLSMAVDLRSDIPEGYTIVPMTWVGPIEEGGKNYTFKGPLPRSGNGPPGYHHNPESTAAAEMELMSSTSREVCELYNGDGIVRCQGVAPVWEYICIIPKGFTNRRDGPKLELRYMTMEVAVHKEKLLKEHKGNNKIFQYFSRNDSPSRNNKTTVDQTTGNVNATENPKNDANKFRGQTLQRLIAFARIWFSETKPNGDQEGANQIPLPAIHDEEHGCGDHLFLRPTSDEDHEQHDPNSQQQQNRGSQSRPTIEDKQRQVPRREETQAEPKEYLTVIRDISPNAPNISLNLQNSQARTGIRAIAVIGTVLQVGVLVFFGIITYYHKVRPDFQKDDKAVAPYAFPMAATGTIMLVSGLFLCALVVESSTEEIQYEANEGTEFHILWIQQGQTVNDQVFESYATRPAQPSTTITKSFRSNDLRASREGGWVSGFLNLITIIGVAIGLLGFFLQFIGLRAMNSAASLAQLGAIGIMTICRALIRPGYSRSFKRTKLLPDFELDWLAHELGTTSSPAVDHAAQEQLSNVSTTTETGERNVTPGRWAVATGCKSRNGFKSLQEFAEKKDSSYAQELMEARREVCKLANFQSKASEEAIKLATAIEDALGILFPGGPSQESKENSIHNDFYSDGDNNSDSGGLSHGSNSHENVNHSDCLGFRWFINVIHDGPASSDGSREETESEIWLDLRYTQDSWSVLADSLDAVLSLWTYTSQGQKALRESEDNKADTDGIGKENDLWLRRKAPHTSLRLFGPGDANLEPQVLQDIEWWAPQSFRCLSRAKRLAMGHSAPEIGGFKAYPESRVVGHAPNISKIGSQTQEICFKLCRPDMKPGSTLRTGDFVIAVEGQDSLVHLYAKDLLFSFLCSAAKRAGIVATGRVELRRTTPINQEDETLKFLWNQELTELAEKFRHLGFGPDHEIWIGVIAAFSMADNLADNLPFPSAWFESVALEAADAFKAQGFHDAYSTYKKFLDSTQRYIRGKNAIREHALAFLVVALNDLKLQNHDDDMLSPSWALQFSLTKNKLGSIDQLPQLENAITQKDICGRNTLHYAAMKGRADILKLVKGLSRCAAAVARDCHGYTPLHYACLRGHTKCVRYLLFPNGDPKVQAFDGSFPMHLAAEGGSAKTLGVLIDWARLPPNAGIGKAIWRFKDHDGRLPVHRAVMRSNEEAIETLKVDMNEADISGRTSLHLAILSCEPRLIRMVYDLSTEKNKPDEQGLTALALAVDKGKWKAARVLIEAGADLNARNRMGQDVLDLAMDSGADLDLIQLLLQRGASISLSRNAGGYAPSAIHKAASYGDMKKRSGYY
ncbi:ankyrin repeat protein [Fusarium circinatum]|uniref:Ankyrin repeat protein n=1 Tax=Fusarium circinatum TaxID=48490 RepID=A0A8H5TYH5_FUSCI|nr:ankyrin repeat protein [Fusarium circinatum]